MNTKEKTEPRTSFECKDCGLKLVSYCGSGGIDEKGEQIKEPSGGGGFPALDFGPIENCKIQIFGNGEAGGSETTTNLRKPREFYISVIMTSATTTELIATEGKPGGSGGLRTEVIKVIEVL